jgi:hypothetical protein
VARLRRVGVASVVLCAVTAAGASGAQHDKRAVELAIAVDVVQTTSWTAHGSYAWCAGSTQRLPFDGSGQATLHVSLPADEHGAATPGAPISFAATLGGTVERSGSYVEHDGAVTSRPPGCPAIDTADVPADTTGCGQKAASVAVTLQRSGAFGSQPGETLPFGCPWPTDIHDDASQQTPAAILDHVETYDGLAAVALPRLSAPSAPSFAPTTAAKDQTQSWQVDIPGGTLAVTTTTQVRARIALLPLIQTGRSIAGIRVGETLAELRRATRHTGGLAISDDGDLVDSAHRWEWHADAGVAFSDARGNRLYEDVWISSPAGHAHSSPAHRIGVKHGPPPPSARVTRIGTVSSAEVTEDGLGERSTLADLRRARPHGKLVVFGGPIAWVVNGPGRRRTAFMLYRGVVQNVQIGCRQTDPKQRGAPVDTAALC